MPDHICISCKHGGHDDCNGMAFLVTEQGWRVARVPCGCKCRSGEAAELELVPA